MNKQTQVIITSFLLASVLILAPEAISNESNSDKSKHCCSDEVNSSAKEPKIPMPLHWKDKCRLNIAKYTKILEANPKDAQTFLKRAYEQGCLGQFKNQISDCTRAIELDPTIAIAYSSRASAEINLNQYKKAMEDLNKAIQIDPNNSAFYDLRASIYINKKNYKKAIEEYTQSIRTYSNFARTYRNRGKAYIELEQYKNALADFSKAIELNPKDAQSLSDRGYIYGKLGQLENEKTDCLAAIKLDPDNKAKYSARHHTALEYSSPKKESNTITNVAEKKKILERVGESAVTNDLSSGTIKTSPKSNINPVIAKLPTKKDYLRTIKKSQKRLKKNPKDAGAYIDLGYAYRGLYNFKKDIEYCNKAIELNPNIPVAYGERAQAYSGLYQYRKALKDLYKAIELDPHNSAFHSNLGWTYLDQGEFQKAIEACTNSIEIFSGFSPAFYCRGRAYFLTDQIDKAIDDYSEAIKLYPDEQPAYYIDRSIAYERKGQISKALADFNTAIKLDPFNAHFRKGFFYHEQSLHQKAINEWNKCIKLDSKDFNSLNNRGLAYMHIGKITNAISDLTKAIKLSPESSTQYSNRGIAFTKLKKYDRAISDFTKAINLQPNNGSNYISRAKAYIQIREYEKALKDYSKAIETDPEEHQAYRYRGLLYLNRKRYKEAIQDFSKVIDLNPDRNSGYRLLAKTYMKMKDYNNAIVWWNKVLEREPNNGTAIISQAWIKANIVELENAGEEKNVLTDKEQKLSSALNYSTKALELVKQATGCKLSKITMNKFAQWKPHQSRFNRKSPWTPENINKVKEVAKKYPDLAPVLKLQIEKLEKPRAVPTDPIKSVMEKMKKQLSSEEYEYRKKLAVFSPYIAYEREKKGIDESALLVLAPGVSAKEAYSKLKKKFANVELPKVYKPIDAVVVTLPANFGSKGILSLQEKLKPLGYSFFGAESKYLSRSFDTKSEAQKFAGTNLKVRRVPPRYSVRTFDPSKFDPKNKTKNTFWLYPGVNLEKVSSTKWLMRHPEEYRVDGTIRRAVLVKDLDQFDYLKVVGTYGPNYNVTNKMVIDKLKSWSQKYGGIRVISASGDSVKFKVLQEPNDLSQFLKEVFLLCPDAYEVSPQRMHSVAKMKEKAERFRLNQTIGLWWD